MLVPVGNDVYVAHIVAQHRDAGVVSNILLDKLRVGLVRVARVAQRLKGT